jgi:hypothetical protein
MLGRITAVGATLLGFGLIFLIVVALLVRYQYALHLSTTRSVNFSYGSFKLDVPERWLVDSDGAAQFSLHDPILGTRLDVEIILGRAPRGSSPEPVLPTISDGWQLERLGTSSFYATRESTRVISGVEMRVDEHRLEVVNGGDLWAMDAAFIPQPGAYWAPQVRADAAFFRDAVRSVRVQTQQNVEALQERSPAQVELDASDEEFATSFAILLWSVVVFFAAWLFAHLLFDWKGGLYLRRPTDDCGVVRRAHACRDAILFDESR